MELNFHRLWIFLQVIECGGFSAAGTKLYMSQPSVSNQVRQLENSLGATLIDRSGARVRATAEGEVLAEYARRLFALADDAVAAVRQVQGLSLGRLALGATTTVGTYLLPALLAGFQRDHPQIQIDLYVANSDAVTKRLLDGEIGIAVFARHPTLPQLRYEPVVADRMVLVAAPDHHLAGRTVRPDDLQAERFLMREKGSGTRELHEEALRQWKLDAQATSTVSGPEALKQAVRAGLGLTVISEHAVDHEVREGLLAVVSVDPPAGERTVVAGHRTDRVLSPAERAFLDLLARTQVWPH